jgi:hypothetical protein
MPRRRIGQETFRFTSNNVSRSSLDELARLIDWTEIDRCLVGIYASAKGEASWPVALFKAMLLSVWYNLSDVKLADSLDDRASFRRFCGFAAHEATPERTAFVRACETDADIGAVMDLPPNLVDLRQNRSACSEKRRRRPSRSPHERRPALRTMDATDTKVLGIRSRGCSKCCCTIQGGHIRVLTGARQTRLTSAHRQSRWRRDRRRRGWRNTSLPTSASRHANRATARKHQNRAERHLSIAGDCSDKRSQL